MKKKVRTSQYKDQRSSCATSEGFYKYFTATGDMQTLIPGQDGVTEEWIILLDALDHEEDLVERYEKENSDYGYENFKAAIAKGEILDTGDEEYAPMASTETDPGRLLFEAAREDPRIAELTAFIRSLPEDRQNLIYAFFGEQKYLKELAEEENATNGTNVSYQAVQKRLNKAIKACCDFYGVPMPQSRER